MCQFPRGLPPCDENQRVAAEHGQQVEEIKVELSKAEFTFSSTQVITFDPLYACMDFAARVAITCMDSLAKYGGCCGLLIMYGGYSLIAAHILYSSDGRFSPATTELLYVAIDEATV
jgi:hypothetical protein